MIILVQQWDMKMMFLFQLMAITDRTRSPYIGGLSIGLKLNVPGGIETHKMTENEMDPERTIDTYEVGP